jgi:hypothetical protein
MAEKRVIGPLPMCKRYGTTRNAVALSSSIMTRKRTTSVKLLIYERAWLFVHSQILWACVFVELSAPSFLVVRNSDEGVTTFAHKCVVKKR